MVKYYIYGLFTAFVFIILAEMKITIKPFAIALPAWRQALAILMIVSGAALYYDAGQRKGWNAALNKVIEVIDQQKKERQAEVPKDSI